MSVPKPALGWSGCISLPDVEGFCDALYRSNQSSPGRHMSVVSISHTELTPSNACHRKMWWIRWLLTCILAMHSSRASDRFSMTGGNWWQLVEDACCREPFVPGKCPKYEWRKTNSGELE